MAINKITGKSIKDLDLSADDLAPGTVTGAKIAPATVESSNIAPGTIANDRLANTGITINGTSIALGASGEIVAGTDWQAVTVADGSTLVNATAGQGLLLDTNAGVIEVVLPGSPSRGDTIKIVDYGGTFATNNCLVNLNGSFLDSTSLGFFNLSTNDTISEFVYIDANKGWLFYQNSTQASTPSSALISGQLGVSPSYTVATGGTITESGDYKIHAFTGDGCFAVSVAGNATLFACTPVAPQAGPDAVDYLVVAGGGSGANGRGGGGGGGGYRFGSTGSCTGLTISAITYPVTVGGGGSAPNSNGSNSIFSTITSAGGGYGLGLNGDGNPGGSGGGGGAFGGAFGGPKVGGTGNTPPVSPPQGNDGGDGNPTSWPSIPNGKGLTGGGGGGAGAAGNSVGPSNANGGAGSNSHQPIFGSNPQPYYIPDGNFSGGGGGASCGTNGGQTGTGGSGGGGNGNSGGAGNPGTANSGGGGGGSNCAGPGGSGGKGIVLIRYKFQ